jgi:hypothetical protein
MAEVDLSKVESFELMAELVRRRQSTGPALDRNVCVKDHGLLNDAIDQARWGNIGLCGHYLIRAIPGLWPLSKILGA